VPVSNNRTLLPGRRLGPAAAVAVLLGAGLGGGAVAHAVLPPSARSARTISLNETGHLHLTSHHTLTLDETGSASGTISGRIYIHLHIVSTNRVTAEVNIYPSGGSLTGYASASYHPAGPTASFNGSMSIARGTGRYSHSHASGLSFIGTIRRSDSAVFVRVSGRLST
jgi:hypothetical protein